MKKPSKKEAVATFLSSTSVQNNINLNLNTGDIVELMIEENKEALYKVYKDLYAQYNALQWVNKSDVIDNVALNAYKAHPVFKTAVKQYPIITVKYAHSGIDQNRTLPYIVSQLEAADADTYRVPKNCLIDSVIVYGFDGYQKPFIRIEFDLDNAKNDEGVILVLPFTKALLNTVNETILKENEQKLNLFKSLTNVGNQLLLLKDSKKSKAKFIRSILEKSPEGQEVLTNIGSIFNQSTKQLL